MSTLPIFDQLFSGMQSVFGATSTIMNFLFIGCIILVILIGIESIYVGILMLGLLSFMAYFSFATYGWLGYLIIIVYLILGFVIYRTLQK